MGWEYKTLASPAYVGEAAMIMCYDEAGVDRGYLYIERRQWPAGVSSVVKYASIMSLRVSEDFRRQGIGTELVRQAMAWAKTYGYEQVSVEASAKAPQSAVKFYEACGFTPRSIILDQGV